MKIEESVPTDKGNYSCVVSNYLGQIQRFFVVKISERTVAQKPQIAENYPGNNTKVLQGSDLILECPIVVVDSFDPPEMMWFKVKNIIFVFFCASFYILN